MHPVIISNKETLDKFVGGQEHSQFIQSWDWGEFQAKVNAKIWRIGVKLKGELVASAKVIKKTLPAGKSYLYCGRGPVVSNLVDKKEVTKLLFKQIRRRAKEEGIMFLRFDPIHGLDELNYRTSRKFYLVQTHDVQPSKTLILDLAKSEEDLLKEMHQKTRYNINLAEKKEVKIVEGDKDRFEEFWALLDQTSGRDKFRPHGRHYYQTMIEMDGKPVKLFFAEYNNKPIATALVSFFGDSATYLHGGSSNDDRNVMAPYLLQWHAIKLAKEKGHKYYDFHGIDEEKWPGVTRFKKGFGGTELSYPGTFDLVYDEGWYNVYKMIRNVRRTF